MENARKNSSVQKQMKIKLEGYGFQGIEIVLTPIQLSAMRRMLEKIEEHGEVPTHDKATIRDAYVELLTLCKIDIKPMLEGIIADTPVVKIPSELWEFEVFEDVNPK